MAKTISGLEWSKGADETTTGWWYTVDGVTDILESGTLDADSDREQVLEAVARKLHVDAVVEAAPTWDVWVGGEKTSHKTAGAALHDHSRKAKLHGHTVVSLERDGYKVSVHDAVAAAEADEAAADAD